MRRVLILFFIFYLWSSSYSYEKLTEEEKIEIFKKMVIKSLKKEIRIKENLIKCLQSSKDEKDLKTCFKNYAKEMKPIWENKKRYWEKYKQKTNKK